MKQCRSKLWRIELNNERSAIWFGDGARSPGVRRMVGKTWREVEGTDGEPHSLQSLNRQSGALANAHR